MEPPTPFNNSRLENKIRNLSLERKKRNKIKKKMKILNLG